MDYSQYKQIQLRRKFWAFTHIKVTMTDAVGGAVIGFINSKVWKWKQDVRMFADESMQREILRIHARQAIAFKTTFDIIDSPSGQPAFVLQRRNLKSAFVRDHWNMMDVAGNQIGDIQETSSGLALARRWLEIIPYIGPFIGVALAFVVQTYVITYNTPSGPMVIGNIVHHKNPIIVKMTLDTTQAQVQVDSRIAIAAAVMLSIDDAVKSA